MIVLNNTAPAAPSVRHSDSAHWYGHTAERGWFPLYADDKSYGLREARKDKAAGLVAVPSVTTYLGEVKKRQVDEYNKKNAARAAIEVCRHDYPTEEEWMDVVLDRADNASSPAKKLGGEIHAAIEYAVQDKAYSAPMDKFVQPVLAERANLGLVSIAQEKCVGSLLYGYGGKVDDICEGMIIADYKSRGEAKAYVQDWSQISAYGYAEFGERFFEDGAGVVFAISTKNPGEVKSFIKRGRDLRTAFEAFLGLTAWWRLDHNFDPRVL